MVIGVTTDCHDVERKKLGYWSCYKDEGEKRRRVDDKAVSAVVADLISQDCLDVGGAKAHRCFAFASSSMSMATYR